MHITTVALSYKASAASLVHQPLVLCAAHGIVPPCALPYAPSCPEHSGHVSRERFIPSGMDTRIPEPSIGFAHPYGVSTREGEEPQEAARDAGRKDAPAFQQSR